MLPIFHLAQKGNLNYWCFLARIFLQRKNDSPFLNFTPALDPNFPSVVFPEMIDTCDLPILFLAI